MIAIRSVLPIALVALTACSAEHIADERDIDCTHAADEVSAAALARACGSAVAVEAGRTEYADLFVEPSGARTLVTSLVPQRGRRADGALAPLDLTLQRIGDQLAPASSAAHVRFSAGGSAPFVVLTHAGHRLSLAWPEPLPAPIVDGDHATYPEVLPDVDLVVRATDNGFSHVLVVKSPRGAAHARVRRARYRLGGDAILTAHPTGELTAEIDGVRVASAAPAEMWDSAAQDRTRRGTRAARVTTSVEHGELIVAADEALLNERRAGYPLVIDPLFVAGENLWTYATVDNTNGSTTDGKIAAGDPSPAAACLRVGNDPGSSHVYRSFMRFPLGGLGGKQVLSAKIAGRVDHTWKCGENRPTYFYRSNGISVTPRQAWPGPSLLVLLGNNNVHANEDACNEPNMPFEVSTGALINDLQNVVNTGAGDYTIGISAGENASGLNETNTERWMRYFLADFKLSVTYNSKPNTPDSLTVDGKACAQGANRPFVKTTTPTLRAHVADADNDSLEVWFAYAKWNGASFVDVGGGMQTSVPSGGTALYTATGNVDGGIYTFRAQSNDSPSHNPSLASDVTAVPGNCEWQVDVSPPALPTVTADVYQSGGTACGTGACGAAGQVGHFTFASSADTQSYLWGFSDPPTTLATPASLGAPGTVAWTPASAGARTLYVRAIDRAGNETTQQYSFNVAASNTALARWRLNEPANATTLADDTGHGNALAMGAGTLGAPGRIVPGLDGVSRTALQLAGTGDAGNNSSVGFDASASFSVAAWVKLDDPAITRHVISQGTPSNPSFMLEYSAAAGVWKLTAPSADAASYPGVIASAPPRLHTWTHLVGTYDASTHAMRIYVNGALAGTASAIAVRASAGPIRVGYQWWGALADVQVWNRALADSEAYELVDPLALGNVGEWHMDEIGLGPAFDSSSLAHDLTFYGGAAVPPSGAGKIGTGLRLDGVDDFAAPDDQVLHTDQSFAVSAWVRPSSTQRQTFVAQASAGAASGFALAYGDGAWQMRMFASASDTAAAHATIASAPAVDPTSAYHHLVGVFDAQRREIQLYVDGARAATAAMNAAWQPWDATGRLLIGRNHDGATGSEFTRGDLDEIRVYQGVVDGSLIP